MRRNMGTTDRLIRSVLALLGWWLAATIGYATVGGVIVLIVAGVFVVTASAGICPLYSLLGISTRGGGHRLAHS